jgi:hypothetical protein
MNDHTHDTIAQHAWEHEFEQARKRWELWAADYILERERARHEWHPPTPAENDPTWLRSYLQDGIISFVQYLKHLARLDKEDSDVQTDDVTTGDRV